MTMGDQEAGTPGEDQLIRVIAQVPVVIPRHPDKGLH